MKNKRPANDGDAHETAQALMDELMEEAAHLAGEEAARHPDAEAHQMAARGRAMVERLYPAAVGPLAVGSVDGEAAPPRAAVSHAAIDLAHLTRLAQEADALRASALTPVRTVPPAAHAVDPVVAAVRELDTARIRRLSRAELVGLIAAHPHRQMEADLLQELSDADLRDEVRALRDAPEAAPA